MHYLPDEIILHIIAYLEPSELVNLQHVSRQLLNLSRDNNLWKTLCFSHSVAERRRRRLEAAADIDPRLAELISAANNISNAFDTSVHDPYAPSAEVQQERNREKRWEALRTNWDPSYPEENINWYQDFIQRHAPQQIGWFQDAGNEGRDEDEIRREATGAGILFDSDGAADKLIAPLEDGSISIWDARASSDRQGRFLAKTDIGLLSNRGSDLDNDTRLSQSQAIMTDTGAVECVSIDNTLKRGFFAVQNVLNEVDLNTLQVVARTPFPFAITALSEAHHRTPLTVGTNWTLHLHDTRKPPALPETRCELIGGSTDMSFSRLDTGDFGGHVSLSQPGALSILHLPSNREWDGNGDIWIGGRFTSMLNFDRRFFPKLRGTVHSGARLSCVTSVPHPFIPQSLRVNYPPSYLYEAKETPGHTLITAGEYKGKGSLELYGLSSEPTRSINSSDSRTTRNPQACYQNRQTASSSKLLAVAPHGTRIVFSDGDGNLKWVERDGSTPVRQFNINDLQRKPQDTTPTMTSPLQANIEPGWGDIVQKIIPTSQPTASRDIAPGQENLVVWTGDGKLGMVGFGRDAPFHVDMFEDALEHQNVDGGEKVREREYGMEMRRALEQQARELRWLRGYGLECPPHGETAQRNLRTASSSLHRPEDAAQTSQGTSAAAQTNKKLSAESQRIIAELNKERFMACPSRVTEPKRPNMEPKKRDFWDVVNYDLLCDRSSENSAARSDELEKLRVIVGVIVELVALWKTWGLWTDEEIDKGVNATSRLLDLVGKLRSDLDDTNLDLANTQENRAEARSDANHRKEWHAVQELLATQLQLNEKTAADIRTIKEAIVAMHDDSDLPKNRVAASAKAVTAVDIAEAEQSVLNVPRELLPEKKELIQAKEAMQMNTAGSLRFPYLSYHEGMEACASDVQNPKYRWVFGWKGQDGGFVQNAMHPYWRGQMIAKWLSDTGALYNDQMWQGAEERDPKDHGLSLKHPHGVIDNTSYWAGLRHYLEDIKPCWDDQSWTELPKDEEWVLNEQIE